jgi:phage repressor protein C with HTH and peptisase S24 domain
MASDTYRFQRVVVEGDAMAPTIERGDLIVVDIERDGYDGDAIYLVGRAPAAVLRRIQRLGDGTLRLSCDNPRYEPEPAAPGETMILGRVVAHFRPL